MLKLINISYSEAIKKLNWTKIIEFFKHMLFYYSKKKLRKNKRRHRKKKKKLNP